MIQKKILIPSKIDGNWSDKIPITDKLLSVEMNIDARPEPNLHLTVYADFECIGVYNEDVTHSSNMFKMEYIHQPGEKRVALIHPFGSPTTTFDISKQSDVLRFVFDSTGTPPPPLNANVITGDFDNVTKDGATLYGNVASYGAYGSLDVYFEFSENNTLSSGVISTKKCLINKNDTGKKSGTIDKLKANTNYFYRFVGKNGSNPQVNGEIKTFKTKNKDGGDEECPNKSYVIVYPHKYDPKCSTYRWEGQTVILMVPGGKYKFYPYQGSYPGTTISVIDNGKSITNVSVDCENNNRIIEIKGNDTLNISNLKTTDPNFYNRLYIDHVHDILNSNINLLISSSTGGGECIIENVYGNVTNSIICSSLKSGYNGANKHQYAIKYLHGVIQSNSIIGNQKQIGIGFLATKLTGFHLPQNRFNNGCTIYGRVGFALYNSSLNGNFAINGGTFVSNPSYYIFNGAYGNSLTINNGSFKGSSYIFNAFTVSTTSSGYTPVTINGGTFKAETSIVNGDSSTITVNGGIFTPPFP